MMPEAVAALAPVLVVEEQPKNLIVEPAVETKKAKRVRKPKVETALPATATDIAGNEVPVDKKVAGKGQKKRPSPEAAVPSSEGQSSSVSTDKKAVVFTVKPGMTEKQKAAFLERVRRAVATC
jgi:hypothetical protein